MALIDVNLHTSSGEARDNFLILRDLTRKLVEGQKIVARLAARSVQIEHQSTPSARTDAGAAHH